MLSLQVAHQVEDAGAHADIEHRHRLVGDDEARLRISARAITIRCNWPPDSWCGYLSR